MSPLYAVSLVGFQTSQCDDDCKLILVILVSKLERQVDKNVFYLRSGRLAVVLFFVFFLLFLIKVGIL